MLTQPDKGWGVEESGKVKHLIPGGEGVSNDPKFADFIFESSLTRG